MTVNRQLKNRTRTLARPNGLSLLECLVGLVLVIALIAVLISFMLPAQRVSRPAARSSQCRNNLKQIAMALHHYADAYGVLPPAYTVDAEGKPLHSWRTLILPYLEQQKLYDKIDLMKPWDDPVNAEAGKSDVWAYSCPSAVGTALRTTYQAIVTSESQVLPIARFMVSSPVASSRESGCQGSVRATW